MNDKEYTYDIDKYTIGVDENGEDGIGMTVAKIENGGIKFLGNCYGENARCIDLLIKENQELKKHLKLPKACNLKTLEDYKSYYEDTTREQILEDTYIEYRAYVNLAHRYSELKKQLEEANEKIILLQASEPMLNYKKALEENQQKEFIKWLKDNIDNLREIISDNQIENNRNHLNYLIYKRNLYTEILQKYKSIIEVSNENNKQ